MENSLTDTDNFDYDRRSRISESKRKSISDESEVALHPTMAAAGLVFAARNDFQVKIAFPLKSPKVFVN